MELVIVAGALVGGTTLAAGALWAAMRYARGAAGTGREAPVELEIIDDERPATFHGAGAIAPAKPPVGGVAPAYAPASSPVSVQARPAPPAPPRPTLAPPRAGVLAPRGHVERAPAMVLTRGVEMQDAAPASPGHAVAGRPFVRAPPSVRAPMREPPSMKSWAQQVMEESGPEVQTEWARRQVGPVEAGRTSGACGGCGARLSVSAARPLRIACPVCGRTKLLAS